MLSHYISFASTRRTLQQQALTLAMVLEGADFCAENRHHGVADLVLLASMFASLAIGFWA